MPPFPSCWYRVEFDGTEVALGAFFEIGIPSTCPFQLLEAESERGTNCPVTWEPKVSFEGLRKGLDEAPIPWFWEGAGCERREVRSVLEK